MSWMPGASETMRLLLDTHTFIWWLAGDERLGHDARGLIADEGNEVLISSASAWEITTKFRIGKLPSAKALAMDIRGAISSQGFGDLPITVRHAELAGSLPGPHRDPFDRMLIAQAVVEDLGLVSNEAIFDSFGVRRMW